MRADFGRTAHFLCDGKGALKHLMQISTQSAGFIRLAHGIFHLTKNLCFAQHHGIQPGGDTECVADSVVLRQRVQMRAQVTVRKLMKVSEKMCSSIDRIVRTAGRIQFGAVAGGQNGSFIIAG